MEMDGPYLSDTEMARRSGDGMTWRWRERSEAGMKRSQALGRLAVVAPPRGLLSPSAVHTTICSTRRFHALPASTPPTLYVGVDRLTKIAHFGATNTAHILGHVEEKEEENPTMKLPLAGARNTRGEGLS
jgi:hypothetical protein